MKDHVYSGKVKGRFIADEKIMPRRATYGSAGYDFKSPFDHPIVIPPHETVKFGSGVKVRLNEGCVLLLFIRSSLGLKHGISLPNSVAVIDSDYEDEIVTALRNDSDKEFVLDSGERYMQGIFLEYGLEEHDNPTGKRTGGVGSTGK